jgi:hypothetical protein
VSTTPIKNIDTTTLKNKIVFRKSDGLALDYDRGNMNIISLLFAIELIFACIIIIIMKFRIFGKTCFLCWISYTG